MGDPKTTKKKFDTPRHPWVKEVINSEKELMKQYGLKNKKEVWKFKTKLRDFKSQSKQFSHNEEESEKQEAFLKKLRKLGILDENSGVDEELLIIYIKDKTKLPTRDIKKMLDKQEEFYNKLVKEEVVNSLENDNK